ncbi:MAG: sulfatase-like hydrolase/transferase [Alysiella sp.]|uniref:sulfatase-like hydrolase/transferase n=1 Tax=Alysiella sp. TaxID=1872483 RepID=UPI0026DB5B15|nr:sulfatase-like hydrolase/transferase [Alysiella sp.]MDO4433164.1 sulfatase-like hydrolase/transferase [Alysiella sp.]
MSIRNFLTKDHQLPPFSTYRSPLLWALVCVLLPNLFFWIVAGLGNLARPLINFDYFLPVLLMALPLPWRLGKILGGVALVFAIAVDLIMFAMQIFPFLDIAAIRYLAPFIHTAPLRLLLLSAVAIIYALLFPFLQNWTMRKTSLKWVILILCVIGLPSWYLQYDKYHETYGLRFARGNHYFAHSQVQLYRSEIGDDFYRLTQMEPVIMPNHKENASQRFRQPFADKVLLVVAESWGMSREPTVHRAILQNIYNQQENLAFIEEGFFDFYGATVQGEIRELCNFNTENGYAFSKLPAETFESCLPNVFKKAGYQTVGLHGASSLLYDRNAWYPHVGFQKTVFGEHLLNLKKCYAFNGVCDEEMLNIIGDEFKQAGKQKTFVYWLTLTAHLPYDVGDMRSERFDCDALNVTKGDICNNMRLQSQLFDDLGELIKRPEMKGVEVIVVGDHMPPIMGDVPLYKNLHFNDVAWLHFKVKE